MGDGIGGPVIKCVSGNAFELDVTHYRKDNKEQYSKIEKIIISKIDNCKVGDWVVLWGDNISINKFAETNSLISYELMTKISPRVKKTFVEL